MKDMGRGAVNANKYRKKTVQACQDPLFHTYVGMNPSLLRKVCIISY